MKQMDQISSSSKHDPFTYEETVIKQDSKINKNFINLNEKMARDKMSSMIGEKIIGKIFTDNLKDFE